MKPNFALDLTHDSVSLLHRTPNGWLFVGKVMLDADDLAGEIAFWRGTAQSLAPHGMTSKLVIPNSEVLYRRLNAPGPDDKSRDAQIRAQIDGLTPYALNELVFDWVASADGKSVDVAVVARETLAEAEAFAVEHKLNPVSFVAKPGAADFAPEPFFGATRCAAQILGAGIVPEREAMTIAVTGKAAIPDRTGSTAVGAPERAENKPAAADTGSAVPGKFAGAATAAKVGALSSFATKIVQTVRPSAAVLAPAPKPAPPPEATSPSVVAPSAPQPVSEAKVDKPLVSQPATAGGARPAPVVAPVSADAPRPAATETPIVAFRSGRSGTVDPVVVPPSPMNQPASRLQLPPQPVTGGGGFADSAKALLKGKKPGSVAEAPPPAGEAAKKTPDGEVAKKPVAVDAAGAKAVKPSPPSAPPPSLRSVAAGESVAKPVSDAAVARPSGDAATKTSVVSPAAAIAEKPELQPDARKAEAEAMTVFGARRNAQDETGFMKRGVLLTIGLLLILAAIALASVFLTSGRDADVATQTNVAPAPVAPPEPLALTQDDASLADEPFAEDMAVADALTPAPDADVAAEAMTATPEVDAADIAAETPPVIMDSDAAVMEALGLAPETDAAVVPDTDVAAEASPPAELATGDVQLGPQGSNAPVADQGGFSLSTTTAPALADLIAGLPALSPPGELPSLPPPSLAPPAPFGTEFDLGADGLVVPTPDGALTPQGVRVHSGSPSVTPPARPDVPASFTPVAPSAPVEAPDAIEPVQQGAAPELDDALRPGADPALAGFRPQSRPLVDTEASPDSVATAAVDVTAPQDETVAAAAQAQPVASPGGLALTALAGVRPAARPSDLIAGAGSVGAGAVSPASEDLAPEEIVADNPLAVAASRRPNNRPSDFSTRVQAAIAAAQRAPASAAAAPPVQQASAAAAATPRPSIPSSASVAEQATETRAINLRRVNLLGVFGTANNRAALVRLSNGNVVRVSVGDRLDGGQVSAISETQLRYVKSGRNQVLTIGSSS